MPNELNAYLLGKTNILKVEEKLGYLLPESNYTNRTLRINKWCIFCTKKSWAAGNAAVCCLVTRSCA